MLVFSRPIRCTRSTRGCTSKEARDPIDGPEIQHLKVYSWFTYQHANSKIHVPSRSLRFSLHTRSIAVHGVLTSRAIRAPVLTRGGGASEFASATTLDCRPTAVLPRCDREALEKKKQTIVTLQAFSCLVFEWSAIFVLAHPIAFRNKTVMVPVSAPFIFHRKFVLDTSTHTEGDPGAHSGVGFKNRQRVGAQSKIVRIAHHIQTGITTWHCAQH